MAIKLYISVFITSTRKFRAKISREEDGKHSAREVTVGGRTWNEDRTLRSLKPKILKKCEDLLVQLETNLNEVKEQ